MIVSETGYFDQNKVADTDLVEEGIQQLLWMALPEAILRPHSGASFHSQWQSYFKSQPHDNLLGFLRYISIMGRFSLSKIVQLSSCIPTKQGPFFVCPYLLFSCS